MYVQPYSAMLPNVKLCGQSGYVRWEGTVTVISASQTSPDRNSGIAFFGLTKQFPLDAGANFVAHAAVHR